MFCDKKHMILHKYHELKKLIEDMQEDVEKFVYTDNKSASVRLRHSLSKCKKESLELRSIILEKRKESEHEKKRF